MRRVLAFCFDVALIAALIHVGLRVTFWLAGVPW